MSQDLYKVTPFFPFLLQNQISYFTISQSIGAVNCIVRKNNGKLFGCNTDYVGAISAIEDGLRGFFYASLATQTTSTNQSTLK